MNKGKLIAMGVVLLTAICIAMAAEQEIIKPLDVNTAIFCENCLADGVCLNKLADGEKVFHCDKTCTLKLRNKENKELWYMRLNSACVSFSKNGYPAEIKALKESPELQNINGFLIKMFENDYIWFDYSAEKASSDINRLKINTYGKKRTDGTISPIDVCGMNFYPRSSPITSELNVNRPLKSDGKTQACEITSYRLSNKNEGKTTDGKPQYTIYDHMCGDISYSAYDNGLNTISCEPKIYYVAKGQENRLNQSKLYCSDANLGCRQSAFIFNVNGESKDYPLVVKISGSSDSTKFRSIVSDKEAKTLKPIKTLDANNFIIGEQSFWIKPKVGEASEVIFSEEPLPIMYVPNGIEIQMGMDTGQQLTYKYLPEFSKSAGQKFKGYLFKFDPQKQYPSFVYPVSFNLKQWDIKNMAEAKLFAGSSYHAGMVMKTSFDGGVIKIKDKDGKEQPAYKNIIVEWRVNPDLIASGSAQKDAVGIKPCVGSNCKQELTASKQCGNSNTMVTKDYQQLSDYVMERLGYTKKYSELSADEKGTLSKYMTLLIKANEVKLIERYDPKNESKDDLKYVAEVKVKNKDGKEVTRIWSNVVPTIDTPATATAEAPKVAETPKAATVPAQPAAAQKATEVPIANKPAANPAKRPRTPGARRKKTARMPTTNAMAIDGYLSIIDTVKGVKPKDINAGDNFNAPGSLLYQSCRASVNVGASKDALSTVGWTKVGQKFKEANKLECKDGKLTGVLTRETGVLDPAKNRCSNKDGIYNIKCVNNEVFYKLVTKCTCTVNSDGSGKCVTAAYRSSSPSASSQKEWTPVPKDLIKQYNGKCRGETYYSDSGTFKLGSNYCTTVANVEALYQFKCIDNVPNYKTSASCQYGCTFVGTWDNSMCKTKDITSKSSSSSEAAKSETGTFVSGKYIVSGGPCDSYLDCKYIAGDEIACVTPAKRCAQVKCSSVGDCPTGSLWGLTAKCKNGVCKLKNGYRYTVAPITYAIGRTGQGISWLFQKAFLE